MDKICTTKIILMSIAIASDWKYQCISGKKIDDLPQGNILLQLSIIDRDN